MANRVSSEILLKVRDKASASLRKVQKNFEGTSRSLQKMGRRLRAASRGTEMLQKRLGKIGHTARNAGVGITAGITVPATLAARSAIKGFQKIEDGILGVGKTTDLTQGQLDALKEEFVNLGTSVPIATEKMFQFAGIGGQLGLETAENIKGFAIEMGKLEVATNLAGEEAAIILAQVGGLLNVFEQPDGFKKFGSAIVNVGNNMKATESQIVPLLARVAQGTQVFGLTAEQTVGLAGAMADLKINAEAGGTQVGKSFFAIRTAINEGGEALRVLESITGRTGRQLQEELGEKPFQVFKRMVFGLQQLEEQGKDSSKALQIMGLDGVRAQRVFGVLATRFDRVERGLEKAKEGFNDINATQEEFDKRARGLSARLELFDNRILKTQERIGTKLRPAFESLLGAVEKVADFLSNNPGFTKFLIWATAAFAVLGPLLLFFGQLTLVVQGLVPVFALLGKVGLAAMIPILLPAIKIIAIIGAIVGVTVLLIKYWDELAAIAVRVWNSPLGFLIKWFTPIGLLIQASGRLIKAWEPIKSFFIELGEVIAGVFREVGKILSDNFATNALESLVGVVDSLTGGSIAAGARGELVETQPRGSELDTERAAAGARAQVSRAEASVRFDNLPPGASVSTFGQGDGANFLFGPANLASGTP